jgi:hypothetical protein
MGGKYVIMDEDKDQSTAQSLATTLLSYMDRPWKVVSIIILLIIGVVMYTVYEQREVIATAVLQHYVRPKVSANKFAKDAIPLLAVTGADVAQIWGVSLDANQAIPIAGFNNHGAVWMPNPNARPIVHEHTRPEFFIKLVHGDILCSDITPDSQLFHAEYQAGLRHVCGIGVPRFMGIVSGFIYIGWFQHPSPDEEYNAGVNLELEADNILN